MKTPKSMMIGPVEVPIREEPGLISKRELGGYTEFPSGEIEICPDLPPQQAVLTIFHECLHAISAQYGLGLSESKVRVLEMSISALFRDNDDFTKVYFKHL